MLLYVSYGLLSCYWTSVTAEHRIKGNGKYFCSAEVYNKNKEKKRKKDQKMIGWKCSNVPWRFGRIYPVDGKSKMFLDMNGFNKPSKNCLIKNSRVFSVLGYSHWKENYNIHQKCPSVSGAEQSAGFFQLLISLSAIMKWRRSRWLSHFKNSKHLFSS